MKILIIKTGALGDLIGASSFFQTVKENFPDDNIYLLTQEIYRDVVDSAPIFTKIFYLPEGYHLFAFLKVIVKTRRLKPDIVLDIQGTLKTNFYSFITGGKRRYGSYKKKLGRLFLTGGVRKRRSAEEKPRPSILKFIGVKKYIKETKLWVPEEKRKMFGDFIKGHNLDERAKWILMHPLTAKGYLAKRWEKEKFAALSDKLMDDGYEVIFIGSGEREYVDDIISKMKHQPKNLVDETDFHNLCLLIEKASLMITTDSGPLHISAAEGINVIGLFGSSDPRRHCPKKASYIYKKVECSPCYKKVCRDMKCMKAITVDEVYEKVKELMNEDKYSLFN